MTVNETFSFPPTSGHIKSELGEQYYVPAKFNRDGGKWALKYPFIEMWTKSLFCYGNGQGYCLYSSVLYSTHLKYEISVSNVNDRFFNFIIFFIFQFNMLITVHVTCSSPQTNSTLHYLHTLVGNKQAERYRVKTFK